MEVSCRSERPDSAVLADAPPRPFDLSPFTRSDELERRRDTAIRFVAADDREGLIDRWRDRASGDRHSYRLGYLAEHHAVAVGESL